MCRSLSIRVLDDSFGTSLDRRRRNPRAEWDWWTRPCRLGNWPSFSEWLTEIFGWSIPGVYLVAGIFIEALGVQGTRARAEEKRTPKRWPISRSGSAHSARPPTTKPTDLTAHNRQYALSENSASNRARWHVWMSSLCRLTTTHDPSRRWLHSRPTNPPDRSVSPGQSVLTTSFATRGSRVKIPSAPPNALVRTFSVR